jgi:hypothetical protein
MPDFFTSYKASTGFKLFGKDWEEVYELCRIHGELRFDESRLIKRILHVSHKISKGCEDEEGYMMILQDLRVRVGNLETERQALEVEIGKLFDEVTERSTLSVQLKVKQLLLTL